MLCRPALLRLTKGLRLRDWDLVTGEVVRGMRTGASKIVYGRAWKVWHAKWTELTKGRVTWGFV